MTQEINIFEDSVELTEENALPSRMTIVKQVVEALIFSSGQPLPLTKLKEIIQISFPISGKEIKQMILLLNEEYTQQKRSFQIDEIAGGYLLRTRKELHPFIEPLYKDRRGEQLSQAALETVAIIAYNAPITRAEVENIRGVDSSGVIASLCERGLIEGVDRKSVPGRPWQYGVTKRFLEHFGLKNIQELHKN